MNTKFYILIASLMFLYSCNDTKITDEITRLQSSPIDMTSCMDAFCCKNGEETVYDSENNTYKLIIYIDSLSCSPCFITNMHDYMESVADFDSVGISTLFIFEPKHDQVEDVKSSLKQMEYPAQIAVIPNGSFSSANPNLPSSTILHSFLLNKNNEVVIVGNPVRNSKIKELMLKYVKEQ